ncbi:endolytic transglycosylase MltG [Endozoicomonas sp. SCSIO W0465]|uniref:endolytic transglycosylase MltG n=1 Tax=Endozoicomonas sp. SCSIO W0465 TaxID=2918516 RepID=UPI002075249C|nr:endolytic transglycosylase MltG [Endozoicomonas sp. SCSIO W0465]USE34368.1 endolytic transglycosylase MltG [Endozoicomonas sp. SCSIO W0465]
MLRKLLLTLFGGLLLALLLVMAGLAAGWYGLRWYGDQKVPVTSDAGFIIVTGDSLGRVVQRLSADQLINYPEIFKLFARVRGVAADLQAGEYLIAPGTTYRQLLNQFVEGDVRYFSVTLVEGWTLRELLVDLNSHPKLSAPVELTKLTAVVGAFIKDAPQTDNLEGLFYADTYSFEAGTSVVSILKRAHQKLQSVLAEEWDKKAEDLPYKSPYEALIMASIIEKETGVTSERPDIAGVFVRRLEKRMRLQTDPTVIYGMGDRYEGKLNRRMLREPTAYNTYVIHGLPPTPIATVGREAIQAALNPSDGKTLYFVARGDGTHHFSKTLAEHNRAVRKYQITERREDYRSTVQPSM